MVRWGHRQRRLWEIAPSQLEEPRDFTGVLLFFGGRTEHRAATGRNCDVKRRRIPEPFWLRHIRYLFQRGKTDRRRYHHPLDFHHARPVQRTGQEDLPGTGSILNIRIYMLFIFFTTARRPRKPARSSWNGISILSIFRKSRCARSHRLPTNPSSGGILSHRST